MKRQTKPVPRPSLLSPSDQGIGPGFIWKDAKEGDVIVLRVTATALVVRECDTGRVAACVMFEKDGEIYLTPIACILARATPRAHASGEPAGGEAGQPCN